VAGNGFHISQKWIIFWESEMVNALVYAAEPIGIKRRYFFMQVMAPGMTTLPPVSSEVGSRLTKP